MDIFEVFGKLLVSHSAPSAKSLDTSSSTVSSDNSFQSESDTEQFETIVTDSGSEIFVPFYSRSKMI